LYLVVVKDNEVTLFAAKSMLEGEMDIGTIAEGGEVRWCDAISHGYDISVLLGGEFSPVYCGGKSGQPHACVLCPLNSIVLICHQI
jgi:hypothetical protein